MGEPDEMAVLNEVSRKGYYHNRPQNQEATAPQRIDPETTEFKRVSFTAPRKRTTEFVKKTYSADAPAVSSQKPKQPTADAKLAKDDGDAVPVFTPEATEEERRDEVSE